MISVSPASRAVLGYDPEELIGRAGDDFVLVEDLPVILAMRNRAREVDDVSATFRLVRRDGRPIWVEAKLHIVRDAAGRVAETHAIVRDVHERVEAQRALAEAEERFRTAFEEGAAGMAIVSPDGRLLRVNRALCAITGHQPAELEGRTMLSLLHPDDRPQHDEESERMLSGQIATARGERRYLHDDGHVVWVSVSTTLVRDAGGAPLHFLTQAQDVTERRRYEAELRHMADHDALTGLLNRRAFERELERHVDHVARYGPRGAARADRRRPVQERQRHARPQRRRPADRQGRRRAARAAARRRGDRPPRRRRVRRAGARRRPGGRASRSPATCSRRSAPCASPATPAACATSAPRSASRRSTRAA